MCRNRDKTQTQLISLHSLSSPWTHADTYMLEPCQVPGHSHLNLLIGCVFWQANLKSRRLLVQHSLSLLQTCIFNDLCDKFILLFIYILWLYESQFCREEFLHMQKSEAISSVLSAKPWGCRVVLVMVQVTLFWKSWRCSVTKWQKVKGMWIFLPFTVSTP